MNIGGMDGEDCFTLVFIVVIVTYRTLNNNNTKRLLTSNSCKKKQWQKNVYNIEKQPLLWYIPSDYDFLELMKKQLLSIQVIRTLSWVTCCNVLVVLVNGIATEKDKVPFSKTKHRDKFNIKFKNRIPKSHIIINPPDASVCQGDLIVFIVSGQFKRNEHSSL